MIQKLDHQNKEVAEMIRSVFQVSYLVEAQLIGAKEFPPLKRPLEEFTHSDTQFFGYWEVDKLVAVMEIQNLADSTLIQSLVVNPAFFRQGIGGRFVLFALEQFPSQTFNVETGAANAPAIQLYEKYGFKKIKEYLTDHGIRKVRFEKKM